MGKGFTNDAIPALSVCESPIEGKFIQAFFDEMRSRELRVSYEDIGTYKLCATFSGGPTSFDLGIQGTIPFLGGQRVDLAASATHQGVRCIIIVELDGAKYHSSPEQQASDRKRDRKLLEKGFPVVRFAGSEIFADPRAAVLETIEIMYSRLASLKAEREAGFELGMDAVWNHIGNKSPDAHSEMLDRFIFEPMAASENRVGGAI